ncbi:hypothetical protein MKX03_037155, partial [Papaver bracteatum]
MNQNPSFINQIKSLIIPVSFQTLDIYLISPSQTLTNYFLNFYEFETRRCSFLTIFIISFSFFCGVEILWFESHLHDRYLV